MKTYLFCGLLVSLWLPKLMPSESPPANVNSTLTINGQPVNHETFGVSSQGVLALYVSETGSSRRRLTPFRVQLRRGKTVVKEWPSNVPEIYAQSLDEVWPYAQLGDELIIEPTRPSDQAARQVMPIRTMHWYNWFTWPKRSKQDGC